MSGAGRAHMGRRQRVGTVPAMVMNVCRCAWRRRGQRRNAPAAWAGSSARAQARPLPERQLRRDTGLVGAQQRLHGPMVNVQPFYKPLALTGVQATLECAPGRWMT